MQITFEVPGKVKGKARARTFFNAKLNRTMSYTPDQTVNYENLIKMSFMQMKPEGFKPFENAVSVKISAIYRKSKGNKMDDPCLKPDADNIVKVVCDALNGIAFYDDKQVISVAILKLFGEPEKLVVTVEDFGAL